MSNQTPAASVVAQVAEVVTPEVPVVSEAVAPGVTEIRVGEPGSEVVGLVVELSPPAPASAKPTGRGGSGHKDQRPTVAEGWVGEAKILKKLPNYRLLLTFPSGGRPGVMHASELPRFDVKERNQMYDELQVGDELTVKVTSVTQEEGKEVRIILSAKQLLLDDRATLDAARAELIASLKEGQLIEDGVVVGEYFGKQADGRKLCGHFVEFASTDVGGKKVSVTGLLHFREQLPSCEAERGPNHQDLPLREANLVIGQKIPHLTILKVTVVEAAEGKPGRTLFALSENGGVRAQAAKAARDATIDAQVALCEAIESATAEGKHVYRQANIVRFLGAEKGFTVIVDGVTAHLPKQHLGLAAGVSPSTIKGNIYVRVLSVNLDESATPNPDEVITVERINAKIFRDAHASGKAYVKPEAPATEPAAEATSSDESAS